MKHGKVKRWLYFFGGMVILTFGARILLLSGLGVGGLDASAVGLAEFFHISIGAMIILLGMVIVAAGNLINKKWRLSPVMTSVVIGWVYDLWGKILFQWIRPPQQSGMIGLVYLVGLLIAPIGAAIYIKSGISMGPVDYLMWAIKDHSRLSMQASRTILEALFVAIGILVRGPVGIGTVGIMLFWGPILQVYYKGIGRLTLFGRK